MVTRKMIDKVEVEGFGPFKDTTTFPLGRLTIITSQRPDTGKSWALVRSVQWALFNDGPLFSTDPTKDEIRYADASGTKAPVARVKVYFSDGSWVERSRSAQRNSYIIHPAQGETQEFDNFGSGFFDKVQELVGVGPVALDGKTPEILNVRDFFSRVFLLDRSPGQIDTILSRLMGSGTIEDAQGLIGNDLRKTNGWVKQQQAAVSQLGETLAALPHTERLVELLGLLDRGKSDYESKVNLSKMVQGKLATCTTAQQRVATIKPMLTMADGVRVRAEQLFKAQGEKLAMITAVTRIERARSAIKQAQDQLQTWLTTSSLLQRRQKKLGALQTQITDLEQSIGTIERGVDRARSTCLRVELATSEVLIAQDKLRVVETAYATALREAGICPMCGADTTRYKECPEA